MIELSEDDSADSVDTMMEGLGESEEAETREEEKVPAKPNIFWRTILNQSMRMYLCNQCEYKAPTQSILKNQIKPVHENVSL